VVADVMWRTRASYHYAVRRVKKDEDHIKRERIANALVDDPSRNFWVEVKKIRANKSCNSRIVDGCTDEESIAQLFARNYRQLYSSVPYDDADMLDILADLDNQISIENKLSKSDHIFNGEEVSDAIRKLKPHKNDGSCDLTSDHFCHAGLDFSCYVAFLYYRFAKNAIFQKFR